MQRTLSIANYYVKKSDYKVTTLQLIKLVYISYGYVLAILNKKLFSEEIEAWQFGPVIPSIYHTFKHYKKENIPELSTEIAFDDTFSFSEETFSLNQSETDYEITKQILDKVWDKYNKYDGYQLIDLTHKEGTPWSKVFQADLHHIKLKDTDIKEYYNNIIAG